MKVRCHRCGHEWDYKGQRTKLLNKDFPIYICCPLCHANVKLPEKKEKK